MSALAKMLPETMLEEFWSLPHPTPPLHTHTHTPTLSPHPHFPSPFVHFASDL